MKKTILSIIASFILGFAFASPALAQTQAEARQYIPIPLIVEEMKKQLPQEVDAGITWTDAEAATANDMLVFTFLIDAPKMGVTNAEFRKQNMALTDAEFKEALGSGFVDMLSMLGCKGKVVYKFPDGTPACSRIVTP